MDSLKSIFIAASGMKAQASRMRVIAENIANANSTAPSPNEDPYRRKIPVFEQVMDRELGAELVAHRKTQPDLSDFGLRYEPNHPAADEQGYIRTPNVNALIEMADMQEARRSFEANLNVVEAARGMIRSTIGLLRS